MTKLEQVLYEAQKADHEYIVNLRRYFHQHPELAKEEFETQRKIEEELDKLGIEHQRTAGTGVYAEITGTKPLKEGARKRTIVLRADIDALPITQENDVPYHSLTPGKMHACGHDAHNASLIGAARILASHRDLFSGTVRFTWQPGEEIGYGARVIVDEGKLDGADRTFGIHTASNVPVGKVVVMEGPNNASVDMFRIRVHGLGAHVSTPELGVDAAYIASQIVVGVQALVTRRTSPMENALIGIGKITAGTAYNVVAQEALLEGTIRVMLPELRAKIKKELKELAEATARIYGGSCEVEFEDYTSPLLNDPQASREAQKAAISIFGSDNVITSRKPSLTGDDFAEYILKVPGVYVYVGSGNPEKPDTVEAQHSCRFDIDEGALETAVSIYTIYAVEYLEGLLD